MNIEQIRENIKNRRYTASDPELDPIAYPNLHRLNPVQASPDERAAARAELNRRGEALRQQFRADLEEVFNTKDYPQSNFLFWTAWDDGHAHGLYEVLREYEVLVDIFVGGER